MDGFDISGSVLLLGAIFGVGYSLLGIGLVLAYRSSGFINFAHGSVGLVAAAMMSVVVKGYGVPYWLGFLGAIVAGGLLGAAIESVVVRKLADAPKVLAMVATLGTAQALLLLALSFSSGGLGGGNFPQPPGFPEFDLSVFVSSSASALLILSPVVVLLLWLFLQRSRYGVAIRGAAANPDTAALSGVDPRHMATLSWGLAGAIAAFAAMLIIPNQSTVTPEALGPDFIIRGLAVAALARFASLPVALGAGVGIGLVEQIIASNPDATGWFEIVLFVLVLVGVARQVRSPREQAEQWTALTPDERLPDSYRDVWLIRNLAWVIGAPAVALAAIVPLWISNRSAFILTTILAFAIIGISVSFLTGLGGQLSLGQVAFAAIGAVVGVRIATETGSLTFGLVGGGLIGAATSAAVGLPALRVRGPLLAIATLAFALATSSWLLRQDWALGTGLSSRPVTIFGNDLSTSREFYYVALGVFVLVLAVAGVLRRSSFGRALVAVRDNEAAARVLQIAPRRTSLAAYSVAGIIAGLGGVVLAMSNTFVTRAIFAPGDSIDVVSISVIGGLSRLIGPLLGSAYLIGIPGFFDLELSALAALNVAWLILIVEQPQGMNGLLRSTRRNLIDHIARLHGVTPEPLADAKAANSHRDAAIDPLRTAAPIAVLGDRTAERRTVTADSDLLIVDNLTVAFDAVVAVDDVSLHVRRGETLGLIGPNGAGKTTLFEVVSGFVRPDRGTVTFDGVDISGRAPEARSRLGLVRSFQNAALFATMTPREIVFVAQRQASRRRFVLGGSAPERRLEDVTTEVLALFGLGELADQPVSRLSTGTRRIVELAANVSLQPRLLLLDEPSAGISQAETEALGVVIDQIRSVFDVTLVMIEHDMPLLTSVCDRMIAMEVGRVIAMGTPTEVQADPGVIASYLGDDPATIARSGEAG